MSTVHKPVTRRYGHAIIVFDGYKEGLSKKYGADERRTGGRAGSTVDFTRDMVTMSNKEDLLSNKVKAWNTFDAKHVITRVMQMS